MSKKNKKSASGHVQVDVISDLVCPWCSLGKSYLDEAIRKSGRQVEVTYRPYMLAPEIPEEGLDYKTFIAEKFGQRAEKFKEMSAHLVAAGSEAGLTFNFDSLEKRPNTLRAHRLVRWARDQNLDAKAQEALFKAYFQDMRDIGDIKTLSDIAQNIGLDGERIGAYLNTDKDANSVQEEILFYRGLGVSGVPTFIYNGQFAIQGAQPISEHVKAIKQAASLPALEDE